MNQFSACRPADNPFASRRIDRLDYRFGNGTIDDLVAALALAHHRGALVGPHGSGKTTLLENIGVRLEGEIVWIRLNAEDRTPGAKAHAHLPEILESRHVVLVDGAEQLGRWAWWRFQRRIRTAGAIVITSHHSGRLPTLHECTTDPALLQKLVAELAPEVADSTDLDEVFNRHNGNLRLCFRELYDRCAGSVQPRPSGPPMASQCPVISSGRVGCP